MENTSTSIVVARLFLDLCDGVEIINSTFTFQLIVVIIESLVSMIINESYVAFLKLLSILSQLTDVFSAFAIIREIIKLEDIKVALLPHIILIANQFLKKCIMSHSGSSTTKEAENTSIIVSRIISERQNGSDLAGWKTFLSLIGTRNLNLQNVFFKINWNILLGVSKLLETV